ncbi:MAG: envelope stress response membrane protein PspC [Opitutales bacterium]
MNNATHRPPLYRARDGMIFGVCKGLARHFDLEVFWIRLGLVLIFLFTGFFPVVVGYVIAAIFMKKEPVLPPENPEEAEFYGSLANNRELALDRIRRVFDSLERRTRRLESIVVDRERDWDRRFRQSS